MYVPKITFRCRSSTFRSTCDSVFNNITNDVAVILKRLNIYHFFELPAYQQNVPLIVEILIRWNMDKQTFIFNGHDLKFTADEVALVVGLPNRGIEVIWDMGVLSKHSSIDIKNQMKNLKHHKDVNYIVKLYIKFIITNLFFPFHNYTIPKNLLSYAENIDEFSQYNWPEAICKFLVNQFNLLAQKIAQGKSLGYINGFVTIIMIWFLEHCIIIPPKSRDSRPRILRWPYNIFWSSKKCIEIFSNLQSIQVFDSFIEITPEEAYLLADVPLALPRPDVTPDTSTSQACSPDFQSTSESKQEASVHSLSGEQEEASVHSPSGKQEEAFIHSPKKYIACNVNITEQLNRIESKLIYLESINANFDQIKLQLGRLENIFSSLDEKLNVLLGHSAISENMKMVLETEEHATASQPPSQVAPSEEEKQVEPEDYVAASQPHSQVVPNHEEEQVETKEHATACQPPSEEEKQEEPEGHIIGTIVRNVKQRYGRKRKAVRTPCIIGAIKKEVSSVVLPQKDIVDVESTLMKASSQLVTSESFHPSISGNLMSAIPQTNSHGAAPNFELLKTLIQKEQDELQKVTQEVKHHEDNLKFLKSHVNTIHESIHHLQGELKECHSPVAAVELNGNITFVNTEKHTLDHIRELDETAAGIICQVKDQHSSVASTLRCTKDIVGVVALLGKVKDEELSRILSEYLGLDTMLAVVCKTLEGVQALERYEKDGSIDRNTGLHGIAPTIGRTMKGRFHVFCLQNMRPFVGEFLSDDPEKKLALMNPRLPNGKLPPGFLGFAVNMISVDDMHLSCVTIDGHGLRETLFFNLFSRIQVYKSRAEMLCAQPLLTDGAVSLDGGMIKGCGFFCLGDRNDVEIRFPVAEAKPSIPREVFEIEQQIKFMEWKEEMLSSDIQREESLLNTAKCLIKAKSDEYRRLINEELLNKGRSPSPRPVNTGFLLPEARRQ